MEDKIIKKESLVARYARRIIQKFILVWLDSNIDESSASFRRFLAQVQHTVLSVKLFKNIDDCVAFLRKVKEEEVFVVVSVSLGPRLVPVICEFSQVHSIYIFSDRALSGGQWSKDVAKVKGMYTTIDQLCKALKISRKRCDTTMMPISFHGADPLFMYTQLIKEALLEIDEDIDTSIKEFAKYCCTLDGVSKHTIEMIEREYHHHPPIWWYTAPYFLYSALNRGLRLFEVEIILKMGFFIRHLHQNIESLHHQQQKPSTTTFKSTTFQVYRGQGLSASNFSKLKETKGGLMSFNCFLSTTYQRDISLEGFVRPLEFAEDVVGILFVMTIDPKICLESSIPFAQTTRGIGYFEDQEAEVLFSTHTMFRVDEIKTIEGSHRTQSYEVNLTLVNPNNNELSDLTERLRDELRSRNGLTRLGFLLLKAGKSKQAAEIYSILLNRAVSDSDRSEYYYQLGSAYEDLGEYSKAVSCFEQHVEIKKKILPPNHPDFAHPYSSIGMAYKSMGEYSKALSFYEQSLEIQKNALPPNFSDLAAAYRNISMANRTINDPSKLYSSKKQSLEILKKVLYTDQSELHSFYNNIALICYNTADYSEALTLFQQSLEIQKKSLPTHHPDLANCYGNIGLTYHNMGKYAKALSSHKQCLEIQEKALPHDSLDLARTYNNIGCVYDAMGEYTEALSFHQKSIEIQENVLSSNHIDLAGSYNNISSVYKNITRRIS